MSQSVDEALAASQEVSEARKRRHRSTRRAHSAGIRVPLEQKQTAEETRGTAGLGTSTGERGGEETMHSGSAASSSARYRHSLKRREKRLSRETARGGGDVQPHALGEEESMVGESTVPSMDDTTARITSLLQRIDREESSKNDHRSTFSQLSPSPSPVPPNATHFPSPLPPGTVQSSSPLPPHSHSPSASHPSQSPSPLPPQPTLALTVHKTDRLRPDLNITHPMVRVCLVNCDTGELVMKPYPYRCVTSYYEEGVDCILPILTQPWKKKGSSLQPRWEETLLFNEDLSLFTSDLHVLFFELLDFPNSHRTSTRQHSQIGSWYHIAWAFLKTGRDRWAQRRGERGTVEGDEGGDGETSEREEERGRRHVGKVCRLQLYQYPKRHRAMSGTSELWEIWRTHTRKPYPSTLYVTPNEATPTIPQDTPTIRSMDPSQPEVGKESAEQMMNRLHNNHMQRRAQTLAKVLEFPSRLPGHTCHLPTSLRSHLHPPHAAGCSVLAFSPDGRYLGAGCTSVGLGDAYLLVVYEVNCTHYIVALPGHNACYDKVSTMSVTLYSDAHRGFIYSLSWSHDSHMISTASADGIVKVWSIQSGDEVASLPHPCYAYATCFIPPSSPTLHSPPHTHSHHHTLFTGAYDKILRVWSLVSNKVQLIQELKGHRGHVNSICVASSGKTVFSGDSVGEVIVWCEEETDSHAWRQQRAIPSHKAPAPIISLRLHPGGRRLLVHTSTGRLAMLDLRVDRECCFYGVLHSACVRGSSAVSPCGMMVIGGGEGEVKVWNSDNGDLLHSLALTESPFSSLTHHPSLHLLAVSSLNPHHSISLLTHSQ